MRQRGILTCSRHEGMAADESHLQARSAALDRYCTALSVACRGLLIEHNLAQARQSFVPARTNLGDPVGDFLE